MQRNTKKREVIAACFSREGRPLSAAEVYTLASRDHPSLGIATVYRAVKAFVEAGLLVPVEIGGATRYEFSGKRHHPHFHCQECDGAFCLEKCPVPEEGLAPEGFVVHGHNLVISGVCPACVPSGKDGE